jgi:hypothetical protein
MYCSSSCLKCQLIGHQVAPSQRAANISSITVGVLRSISATVSAAVMPSACNAEAARSTRSKSTSDSMVRPS